MCVTCGVCEFPLGHLPLCVSDLQNFILFLIETTDYYFLTLYLLYKAVYSVPIQTHMAMGHIHMNWNRVLKDLFSLIVMMVKKTNKNLNWLYTVVYKIFFLDVATGNDYLAMAEGNFTPAEQRQISWALFGGSPAEPTYAEIEYY